jgi:hypothetical protein
METGGLNLKIKPQGADIAPWGQGSFDGPRPKYHINFDQIFCLSKINRKVLYYSPPGVRLGFKFKINLFKTTWGGIYCYTNG